MQGDNVISIHFVYGLSDLNKDKKFPIPSYGCKVCLDGTFQLQYQVPHSINVLSTPQCNPFDNDEHFDNICAKFESQIAVLNKYFNIE